MQPYAERPSTFFVVGAGKLITCQIMRRIISKVFAFARARKPGAYAAANSGPRIKRILSGVHDWAPPCVSNGAT